MSDVDITFFIHWDKRYKKPHLSSKKSGIFFIEKPISVKWGSDAILRAMLLLLDSASKSKQSFDYVHLISSNDMPLMNCNYFKQFFSKEVYLGFDHNFGKKELQRLAFWWPRNVDFRKHPNIRRLTKFINLSFRIDRLGKEKNKIRKGSNWFSIKYRYVDKLLVANRQPFMYSLCSDELFLQTVLSEFDVQDGDDNEQAARYIDWKRGKPYVFQVKDSGELKKIVNTKYAFARKVSDSKVISAVFDDLR